MFIFAFAVQRRNAIYFVNDVLNITFNVLHHNREYDFIKKPVAFSDHEQPMANAHQKDVCTPPVSQYKPENVTLPTTAVFLHLGKTAVTHQDDRDANDKNAPVLSNHGQHTDHKTESGTEGDPCGLIDNDNLTTMFWSLKMETIDYFLMWISQRKFLSPKLFYPCPKIN